MNDKKYNGIEYDAQFRELDPQTGRWWQIDPKTDEMLMWSTYASNYDNPIRFADPLRDAPNCCKGVWDFVVGIGKGIGKGAVELKDFVVRDAWKGQTWENVGNLVLGGAVSSGPMGYQPIMVEAVDAKLGTNSAGAMQNLDAGLNKAVHTIKHGTAEERGNIFGQVIFALAGTKGGDAGVNAVKTIAKGGRAAEAAGGGRVFWAGGDEVMNAAIKFAKSTGGTTIGMTRAGQNLAKLIERKNIPWKGPGGGKEMWGRLSTVYAKGTTGTAHFFPGTSIDPASIWVNVEKPILKKKGVTIVTH